VLYVNLRSVSYLRYWFMYKHISSWQCQTIYITEYIERIIIKHIISLKQQW